MERACRRRPRDDGDRNPKSRRLDPSSSRRPDPPSPGSQSSSSAVPRSLPVTPVKPMEDTNSDIRRARHATSPIPYNSQSPMNAHHNNSPSIYSTAQHAYTTQVAMDDHHQTMPSLFYDTTQSQYMTPPAIEDLQISRIQAFATNDPHVSNLNMGPNYSSPPPQPQPVTRQKSKGGRGRGKARGGQARRTTNPYATPTPAPARSPVQFPYPYNAYQPTSSTLPPRHPTPTIDLDSSGGIGEEEPTHTAVSGDDSNVGATSVGGRGPNFTDDEDIALCASFLYVSKDPIVGANQTSEAYWKRIVEHFHQSPACWVERLKNSLQKRWSEMAQQTNKFCGHWATLERLNPSGTTEDDKVDQANELYETLPDGKKGPRYKYLHCWRVLRHECKWMDYLSSMKARAKAKAAAVDSMPPPANLDGAAADVTSDTRPLGRDAGKKRRSAEALSSTASAYIECMQQETEATWAQEYKSREDRKLAIEEMKVLDARQAREDAQRAREDEIMRMQLNSMDLNPVQRMFWENEQKRIFMKREREAAEAGQDTPQPPSSA